mmetsp:Transcript_32942/g.63862  ORF Transcript_32942/g.63862 Transcript_32942/m.63862 type:complete len:236 (+) Transcript_32942:110-817(+)
MLSQAELDAVAKFSVISGTGPLIPVPCADNIVSIAANRHMTLTQCRKFGVEPLSSDLNALQWTPINLFTIIRKCLYICCCCWILEFVFKKCCFFLSIIDSVSTAASCLNEGYLLTYALKQGYITQAKCADKKALHDVRTAILDTIDKVGKDTVNNIFRTIFKGESAAMHGEADTLIEAARSKDDVRAESAVVESATSGRVRGMADAVQSAIHRQKDYFETLEAAFAAKMTSVSEA